jgi:hypothetical protein
MADPRYEEMMARQAAAMTEEVPTEEMMMPMAEDEMSMAEGEEAGRGGDTMLAHLTPGELVIPSELAQDPEFQAMVQPMFEENGVSMEQYTVGAEANSINPETGYPEFGFFSKITKPFKKAVNYVTGKRQREKEMKKVQTHQDRQYQRAMRDQKKQYERQLKDMQRMQADMEATMKAEREQQNLLMQAEARKAKRATLLRQRAIKAGSLAARAANEVGVGSELATQSQDLTDLGGSRVTGSRRTPKKAPSRGFLSLPAGSMRSRPK